MKKSLLALAVLGAVAGVAQAQSAVTIYGIVDASVTYNNKIATPTLADPGNTSSKTSLDSGNLQGSRLGFKGVEDLGGGLKAVFNIENGFNVDTGTAAQGGRLFGRTAKVGLSGGFGTVLLGRQKDFIDDLSVYTSVTPFGGIVNNVHANNLDRTEGSRVDNSIRYDSPNVNGFTASAIYGFGETAGQTSTGQSAGIGANYANGPFGVGLAYFQAKRGATVPATAFTPASISTSDSGTACATATGAAGDTCVKTIFLGASYQAGPALVYGSWSQVKQPLTTAVAAGTAATSLTLGGVNNEKTNVFDVGVNYALNSQLSLLASVVHDRVKFVGAADGKVTQFNLGADYVLSKRTDLYAFYANQRAKDMQTPGIASGTPGADNTQNLVTVGIRHKF